jgi:hypothetical protein
MTYGVWQEMEVVIQSLESARLSDPHRLEGTDIYMQEKVYPNQLVLDIRKRWRGNGANYHILHHTHQGVTLQISTVKKKLIPLLPQMQETIKTLRSASETWQVVKNVILEIITNDRKKSWCDGCEIDDPSQHHHDCITLGQDLINPLFHSWSEYVMWRVMTKLEGVDMDMLIGRVQERISASESVIKESLVFLHKMSESSLWKLKSLF